MGWAICVTLVLAASVGATAVVGSQPASAASASTSIQWNDVRQKVDGFGASGAFNADRIQEMPEPQRTQVLDLLFSSTTGGADLSMLRSEVPHDLSPSRGTWNWSASDDQIWLMREAKKRYVNKVWSTVWSPPGWMKTNGSVTGGGSLRSDRQQDFADYLSRYVRELKSIHGIELYAISIANEPNLSTGYDSCVWTGPQMRDFIKNFLAPTFSRDGVNTKVLIAEHEHWTEDIAIDSLNDAQAKARVDILGAHHYRNSIAKLPNFAASGKPVWETEVSNLGTNDDSIVDGLRWAREVHDFMDVAEVNAFHYWWLINRKDPLTGEGLINRPSSTSYSVNKRLYTIGNFSRFVKPGYYRIDADSANPASDAYVSAYKDVGSGRFAIVAINNGSSDHTVTFNLDGFSASSVTPYRTSKAENLAQLPAIGVSSARFTATLPAGSVTTFVGTKN